MKSYTYLYPAPGDPMPTALLQCDPERSAERAAAYLKQGFTAVKFDPIHDLMLPTSPQGARTGRS